MSVVVRRFAASEWQLYRDLRLRALADSPDAFASTYDREAVRTDTEWEERLTAGVNSARDFPALVEVDAVPAGLAWARVDAQDATAAGLFQVWISPDHRRRGVGRQLIASAIDWARGLGVQTMRLDVSLNNPTAVQLYRRAGFVFTGEPEPVRPGSAVDCQAMRLTLGGARREAPATG